MVSLSRLNSRDGFAVPEPASKIIVAVYPEEGCALLIGHI